MQWQVMKTISLHDSVEVLGEKKFLQFVLRSGDALLEVSLRSLREIMQAAISKNCISKIVFLYLVLEL